MKTIRINNIIPVSYLIRSFLGKSISMILLILLSVSIRSYAQDLPDIYVRLNNPVFECPRTYYVDVEVKAAFPLDTIFGMNIRFFYDDDILEFTKLDSFATGYASVVEPQIVTGSGGDYFGFPGPLEWVNGQIELVDGPGFEVPTGSWMRLCRLYYYVDDPNSLNIQEFCPSIVWDLQQDPPPPPANPGFLPGDDGVVITLVDPEAEQGSKPSNELVVQFNWEYSEEGPYFGAPVPLDCTDTICWFVPVSNWSVILAISLMVIATALIMKRRMNS